MGGGNGILGKLGLSALMTVILAFSLYASWRAGSQHCEDIQASLANTVAAEPAEPPVVITVGQECATCHVKRVLTAATGMHANIVCSACHQGLAEHLAAPLDRAFKPQVWFTDQNCGTCHPGRWLEKIKEVTIIKPVPMQIPVNLADWKDMKELEAFLGQDDTDKTIFLNADRSGVIRFNDQCEDAAFQLRDRAQAKGKYLSVIALSPDEIYKWYGQRVSANTYHAICMATVDNAFWYIEPSNDKHWLAIYLD